MEATDLAAYRLPPLKPPIFILGNPRSGTTMLRLMLTCHREIVVPPECGFAVWFYDAYRDWNPSRTAAFVDDLMGARKFCTWGVSRDELTDFFARRLPTSYAEAAALVYECYGRCRGRRFSRWGDKNNFHIDHIDTLDELFPRSFFVHIVRDGRSVACSYQQMHAEAFESRFAPQLPSKIADVAAEWRGNNEKIDAGLAALGPGRSHRLRFEDLVCDTETVLRDLCDALGEAFDPRMLEFWRFNASQELEPAELMSWKKKTLQPPIQSEVDRFRRELEPRQIAIFRAIAGDVLQRYGYRVS